MKRADGAVFRIIAEKENLKDVKRIIKSNKDFKYIKRAKMAMPMPMGMPNVFDALYVRAEDLDSLAKYLNDNIDKVGHFVII